MAKTVWVTVNNDGGWSLVKPAYLPRVARAAAIYPIYFKRVPVNLAKRLKKAEKEYDAVQKEIGKL